MGSSEFGINRDVLTSIAMELKEVHEDSKEVAVVLGGGNIFRGVSNTIDILDRVTADYMGMLATIFNALSLKGALQSLDVPTRVLSGIHIHGVAEPYTRDKALEYISNGEIVIFGGGTGNPFFTTDTAAALRALEINADVLFKGTKVDGVYSSDPLRDDRAERYEKISYIDVLKKGLKVMDLTAISLCMENNLPIVVFNVTVKGNIKKVTKDPNIGTIVMGDV